MAVKIVQCSRYKVKNLAKCRVPEGDDTYTYCAYIGSTSYDSFSYNDSTIRRIVDQKRALDAEELKANEAIRSANQVLIAALAKVERLYA